MDRDAAEIRHAFVKLGMQVGVSVAGIALSITMLATRTGQEGMYLPVITGIIGFWLPSPKMKATTQTPPVADVV